MRVIHVSEMQLKLEESLPMENARAWFQSRGMNRNMTEVKMAPAFQNVWDWLCGFKQTLDFKKQWQLMPLLYERLKCTNNAYTS